MPDWAWVIIAIVVVLIVVVITIYNGLVRLKARVDEAWSDITVQLKRRADLIPNLVETVRGYAKHESQVFENVTAARSAIMSATEQGTAATAKAEGVFEGALKSLFAVAEAYPSLQASANFQQLQAEITDTEDKIQAARRFYNGGVRELNAKIATFPSNVFAGMFGFKEREYFEVEDREALEKRPEVKF
ncbi:MAG: LemA family protein [Candidatus Saccharibacteria bacterium]|nr:LemA family protein [Candidatus Saccharibacteria bacterium]